MKLGSETNSVVNHIYSRSVIGQPKPVVGMGVTFLHWTDRSAGTIFRVFAVGKSVLIETRDDDAKRVDRNGMSEDQDYVYTTRVNGSRRFFKRKADGQWVQVRRNEVTGRWVNAGGARLSLGNRNAYHDFTF